MDPQIIPLENSTTTETNLDLGSDSFAYIGAGIRIASEQDNAVAVENRTIVQVDGDAIGNTAYSAEGDHNALTVGAHGLVWGNTAAVFSTGADNYIENAGDMFGNIVGVALFGPLHGELHNSGTILAGTRSFMGINAGIFVVGNDMSASSQLIDNSGVIATQLPGSFAISSGGNVIDRVINTGRITGRVALDAGNDLLDTSRGALTGSIDMGAGNDTVKGSAGVDVIVGGTGNDLLIGNAGNDVLRGDAGADLLTGGAGADRFIFRSGDSPTAAAAQDHVTDFSHAQHDRIDLHLIDANTKPANDQAFGFIGTRAFTHHAGELHYAVSGGTAFVSGDIDGNGTADFTIRLDHVPTLAAADFIL